jgi:hypothetical protein
MGPGVSTRLRVLIGIPVGWSVPADFVKAMMNFSSSPRHDVAVFYELSATRLDFSLSKIIALAKRFHPHVLLRFDMDCIPTQTLDEVVLTCRSDFRSGFDLVYSPTRHVSGRIMIQRDRELNERASVDPTVCTETFFGALGYSALSPCLIEAYQPHIIEYGPSDIGLRQVRYICRDWKDTRSLDELPKPGPGWERTETLLDVDPELSAKTPIFVANPPNNSEDADICFDVRENGFKIGCDGRLRGFHLKKQGIPNWGSDPRDLKSYRAMLEENQKTEEAMEA